MRLYFVRHGESEANLLQEISNRGLKHGLTETGKQQATTLAQRLRGVQVAKIFCSPLLRAVQTAEILSNILQVGYNTAEALREFDCGILEGKSDPLSWQLHSQILDAWIRLREWEKRIEQGESFLDIRDRFVPFIHRFTQDYGSTPDNIVLVGHGGTYRCMLPLVLSNIDFDDTGKLPFSYAVVIVAEWKNSGLECLSWNGI